MVPPTQGSTDRTVVEVPLADRSYRIQISTGYVSQIAQYVRETLPDLSHAILISDRAVSSLADQIGNDFQRAAVAVRVSRIEVPSGEQSKSIEQFESLLQWILTEGGDRRSVVIAIGGGVVGDLAGFVAASFARGIRFVQVPTTLLAMVDSSVGGKTGINLPGAKNMVGAFWQPSLVTIETDVLSTLPERSYVSGLAEVIKYGVIDDADFFAWLEANATHLVGRDGGALRLAIQRSCECKARVVAEDERETSGRRAILNYGHTFAHAIEATAGYGTLLHGEAVAIGMQMAARLAIDLKLADPSLLHRQTKLIELCGLPTTYASADPDQMIPVMMRDKKVAHGKLRFILPSEIGVVDLVGGVEESKVRKAIVESRLS
ncbi:MAG: 3-dehydroquinate synthase [Planctomycetota bacterium]